MNDKTNGEKMGSIVLTVFALAVEKYCTAAYGSNLWKHSKREPLMFTNAWRTHLPGVNCPGTPRVQFES